MPLDLHQIGLRHGTDKATYHNYCRFYAKHLKAPESILEIGVLDGASMRMWAEYYPDATLHGWDINPVEGLPVAMVDATDPAQIAANARNYDLIIDDGPHTMRSQALLFGILFPYCKTYILEDLHTCQPDRYPAYQDGPSSLEMLHSLSSPLWTPEQTQAIRAKVGGIRIYRDKPYDSWTAIIESI